MQTYARLPVTFSHGEGVYLVDTDGRRYLDALSGISVTNLGHAHPAVTEAIQQQAARLLHTSNLYHIAGQEALADALTAVSGMETAFFCNSGAEANEAAIKLARLYGHQRGVDKPAVIVFENAFHGRTLATLSATGNRKIQAGFEPLVSGFTRAPLNDLAAVQQIAANNPDVVAVLVEPIQGEGGIRVADDAFMQGLRALCDDRGWLLMLDEVQCGNGRAGHYFACQGMGVVPDVITTAKGLGNGVPIGACLAHGAAATVFKAGHHGSTYGGNPLACAAGLAVVNTVVNEGLAERATAAGARLRQQLADGLQGCESLVELRGRGLMIGVQLNRDCGELVGRALAAGLLINVTAGNTIRLLPPLICSDEHLDELATGLIKLIRGFE
ncbi:MAG TPA: aspartate aminotransferase family protein [Haliea salexigens]|uniref:Acetylornithine aminotransferase n=1 Tax=Haliea salexigens TaxID=287487 RepID=A0A3C1KPA0_9GAMM|nr:aspartate aminotransferase family protein [Haliea sp.]HAN28066.1 aspartate aminotransferase family protein [Haliea salexigens]HAN68978.1 aspartate aminotransferase family protein [Halieaceae bacterium]